MKVLLGIMMIAACALSASAQQTPQGAKVLAEVAAGGQAVKGQPFSADTVSESVQILADGNRIVQTSNGKIYRNSDGKIRREMTGGNGGANTFFFNYGPGISIAEPAGQRVLLDQLNKTAVTVTAVPEGEVRVITRAGTGDGSGFGAVAGGGTGITTLRTMTAPDRPLTDEERRAIESLKGHKEGDSLTPEQQKAVELLKAHSLSLARTGSVLAARGAEMAHGFATATGENWFVGGMGDSKWETKSEDLGTQNLEGVTCEGTRRVTTIPAGAIGNERPIEITYERWYSKDLGMVVSSKHSDPRFGDQTYTLKNIVRAEPDPSLFTVPKEFKFTTEPGSATYRVRTPEAEREVIRAKAAAAATAPAAVKQP
jgi:hypothetical protein